MLCVIYSIAPPKIPHLQNQELAMMRTFVFLSAVFLSTAWVQSAESDEAPTVTVQGLRIVKPSPEGQDAIRAFNWMPGTSVSMLVSVPQGGLIAVEDEACQLTMFLDDKRVDLRNPKGKPDRFASEAGFGGMASISEDGKYCSIEVDAPGTPTEGATRLAVAGELVLAVATEKKDFTAKGVSLKKGTKVKAGKIPFTISQVGKPDWGDDPLAVTLEAKQELGTVAQVRFIDDSGKEIESSRSSSMSMGFVGNMAVSWTYNLKKKVDSCDIVVTYWMDKKNVKVPFKQVLSLGF